MKIHQITCPPQHGNGECDGHGSVIKKKARLYLLIGKIFNNITIIFKLEGNHIHTTEEFGDFITKNINNATAIEVSISKSNLNSASNVTKIKEISCNYEYVWMPKSEIGKSN